MFHLSKGGQISRASRAAAGTHCCLMQQLQHSTSSFPRSLKSGSAMPHKLAIWFQTFFIFFMPMAISRMFFLFSWTCPPDDLRSLHMGFQKICLKGFNKKEGSLLNSMAFTFSHKYQVTCKRSFSLLCSLDEMFVENELERKI